MAKRATWSRSNDGFDLVRYGGVRLYLYPHPQLSYIFQWDRDYYAKSGWSINVCQPAFLMQMKSHVIVWSSNLSRGKPKPTKIFIKPNSTLLNKWYFQKDFANLGLFTWRVSLFDPVYPFFGEGSPNMYVPIGTSESRVYYYWWADTGTDNQINYKTSSKEETHKLPGIPYYQYFYGYQPPANTKISIWWWQTTDWKTKAWVALVPDDDTTAIAKQGPFVAKTVNFNWNIYCRYKAYFRWGGDTPDAGEEGYDPNKIPFTSDIPSGVQGRDPGKVSEGILHSWDVRRGIITKKGLKRLLKDSDESSLSSESETEATPHLGLKGPISTKKEPSQDEGSSFEEEPPSKKRRKRQLNRLVDTMVDVVRGLKSGL